MTQASKFGTLLRRYPNRIFIYGGTRVRCRDIRDTDEVPESPALKEAVANQIEEAKRRLRDRKDEREQLMGEDDDSDGGDEDGANDGANWLQSGYDMRERQRQNIGSSDIEFSQITPDSQVIVEPYPRAYRCDCDHLEFFSPELVSDASERSNINCADCGRTGEFDLFPYVFICPRCSHLEQISPEGANSSYRQEGPLSCPTCNQGHVDLIGDTNDVGNVSFEAINCESSNTHGPWELAGSCPECDFPDTEIGDEEASKLIPGAVDANLTRVCLLSDLTRGGVATYEEFKRRSDQGAGDSLDWNLENELDSISQALYQDLGVSSAFSLNNVESSNVAYGYTSTTSRRNSPISEEDKFIRTFDPSPEQGKSARAFMVKEEGRGVFVKFDPAQLLEVVPDADIDTDLEEVAAREIRTIEEASPGPFEEYNLTLVPALHSIQHAMFETAREMAGLEQFLGSKMFIYNGAIAIVERENVGMGGLTQLIIEQDGSVFIEFLERVKDRLESCDRRCDSACPACNYIEDSHCHPFLSREMEEYIPANALLDRSSAFEVMDNA